MPLKYSILYKTCVASIRRKIGGELDHGVFLQVNPERPVPNGKFRLEFFRAHTHLENALIARTHLVNSSPLK
jgi:hypothetical protein